MKKTILLILVLVLSVVTEQANADFTFGIPTLVPNVNSVYDDCSPYISADGLSLYLSEHEDPRPEGYGNGDIWVATRATKDDIWSTPVNLGPPVNTSAEESDPSISADGLSLYFADGFILYHLCPGCQGKGDLWVTTRASLNDAWGPPVNLGPPVNTAYGENVPRISANGLSLYFDRTITQPNSDLYVAKRATTQDDWDTPTPLNLNVNTNDSEHVMSVSDDERVLFFQRGYPPNLNLWMATRTSTDEPFGPPLMLPEPVNLPSSLDCNPNLSSDGATLYFVSNRPGGPGGWDMWQAPILPVVDLNADGIVDAADICIMVDHWGENYSLCDIGPTPLGDGVVDVQDLIVLAEHLFGGIPPVKVDEGDADSQVELELGQILIVTLESNPSTGYRWQQVENQESILEQIGEAEFKPSETSDPPPVGAGGWEIFRFKAVSAGQMTLKLVYHRSWEEGVEPLKTFSIQVVVP